MRNNNTSTKSLISRGKRSIMIPRVRINMSRFHRHQRRTIYAVLRHWDQTPIKLLMVPVIPTMPSSRATQPTAEAGAAKSHRSEMSCIRAAERSLKVNTRLASNPDNLDIRANGSNSLLNLLSLNNTLTLLPINRLLLLLQSIQSIDTGNSTAKQTSGPGLISRLLQALGGSQLPNADHVNDGDRVESQVAGIAKLATDGQVAQHGVDGALVVQGDGGGLEVFNEFADAEDLARRAELLLYGVEGLDCGLGLVCAVQIPGVEAGEVLDCSEEFVAADCVVWLAVSGFAS